MTNERIIWLQKTIKKTDEEMSNILETSISTWESIKNGKELSTSEMYLLNEKTSTSMGYIIKGKVKTTIDRKIESNIKENQFVENQKDMEKRLIDLYSINNFNNYFDFEEFKKCFLSDRKKYLYRDELAFDTKLLLELDNYEVFNIIRTNFKTRMGDEGYSDPKLLEHDILDLYQQKRISDYNFLKLLNLEEAKQNKLNGLLAMFRGGKIKWNSKTILDLLNRGAMCLMVVGSRDEYGAIFGEDLFATRLIKDYCLNNINE
jgi:hypothetical protein